MEYVSALKNNQAQVAMIGDGLNDAGAIQASNLGIAVTDNIATFTPASDMIVESAQLTKLHKVLQFCKTSKNIVITGFIISFLYNIIGLSFAVSGNLSPVIAAILMPMSSITVVVYATMTTYLKGKKLQT